VVVPGHSLTEVAKLLTEEEKIDIFVEKKYVLFDLGHTKLTSRLLEGEYIRYESIIPAEFMTEVTVSRQLLEESADRASLIARENKTNVIIMKIKDNQMVITARAETGNAYEELPASVFGKEIEIAFNAKYILDYLKTSGEEFVTFYFKSNLSPAVIKGVDKKDEDDLYLILPVRM
jgi:DNA polymerase-3 subunit beta